MTNQSARGAAALAVAAALVGWSGCRETDPTEANRPPQTYLVESPSYGESGYYVNHLYWDGFDPDGLVAYYEITVTDSLGDLETAVWQSTTRTDSLVRFPVGGDNGLNQVLGNRFYVRAVDLLGRPDPQPAWIFFAARDAQYPDIIFTTAIGSNPTWPDEINPAIIPLTASPNCDTGFPPDTLPAGSFAEFVWTGVDLDSLFGTQIGSISAYEYRLLDVDNTFIGGSVTDTTARYEDLEPGPHAFVVRAFDDGGLAGENCRYFQVNFDPRCAMRRVRNSCTGEDVSAFRLGTRSFRRTEDPCADDFDLDPWDPVVLGLPALQINPCLPPGYFSPTDTVPTPAVDQAWWFEVEVTCRDTDGTIADLETSTGFCSRASTGELICLSPRWRCAAHATADSGDSTLVIGPIFPGDTRFVVAGIDDLGQRGSTNADTLDFLVDFKPRVVHVTTGLENDTCNRVSGALGDVVEVCATDSLLVVTDVQSGGQLGAPCALSTSYLDGRPAPHSARDFGSMPLPGRTYDLEFAPEIQRDGSAIWVATMPVQVWLRDPDGSGRVEFIRWRLDAPPRVIDVFERVTRLRSPAAPDELTPACFEVRIEHDRPGRQGAEHSLWVDVRDRSRLDTEFAAARTSRQEIQFFVNDTWGTAPDR